MESKGRTQKANENKSWFLEKINKIDGPLTRLMKKRERSNINKVRNKREEVITNIKEKQRLK